MNNTIQTNLKNDSDVKCAQSITFKMEMPYSILLCNQNQNIASRTQTIHDLQSWSYEINIYYTYIKEQTLN